jgi:hypothetical protein
MTQLPQTDGSNLWTKGASMYKMIVAGKIHRAGAALNRQADAP